jgi:hypothetical protein
VPYKPSIFVILKGFSPEEPVLSLSKESAFLTFSGV